MKVINIISVKKTFITVSLIAASMEVKRLLSEEKGKFNAKDIAIFENPAKLKPILNKLSWETLGLLSKKEMYPLEIARQL
ncbi:hypothetical protein E2P47_04010, partial [Candidatus Bathyarchaeota archaeon]